MDYQLLGINVRNRRVKLGWTQERLAREIGVSTSFVGHMERGSRTASLDTLVLMCNAMDVGADQLLGTNLQPRDLPDGDDSRVEQRTALRELLSNLQQHVTDWVEEEP